MHCNTARGTRQATGPIIIAKLKSSCRFYLVYAVPLTLYHLLTELPLSTRTEFNPAVDIGSLRDGGNNGRERMGAVLLSCLATEY